jgi:hypothetical protein
MQQHVCQTVDQWYLDRPTWGGILLVGSEIWTSVTCKAFVQGLWRADGHLMVERMVPVNRRRTGFILKKWSICWHDFDYSMEKCCEWDVHDSMDAFLISLFITGKLDHLFASSVKRKMYRECEARELESKWCCVRHCTQFYCPETNYESFWNHSSAFWCLSSQSAQWLLTKLQ